MADAAEGLARWSSAGGSTLARAGSFDSVRAWRLGLGVTVLSMVGYLLATGMSASLRVGIMSSSLRVFLEVVRLCCLLFTVIVLALPSDEDADSARNALVAALAVFGVSNAALGIAPSLIPLEDPTVLAVLFYPWLCAHYLAGVVFLWAGLNRRSLPLRSAVTIAVGAIAAAAALALVLGDRLPLPAEAVVGSIVVRAGSLGENIAVVILPGMLYGVGGWLAWRVFRQTGSGVYAWIGLGLTVQLFAHLHQLFYAAIFGPTINTSDALRVLAVILFLAGGLTELRRLYRERLATIQVQAADLEAHQELLEELHTLLKREEDCRALAMHELAAPLAAMRAFAHVLRQQIPDQAPGRALAALDSLDAEVRSMQQLVARMDELRTLEREGFACILRPVRLRPVLEEAARFVKGMPGAHPVRVEDVDVTVLADPVRLGQALRNVLANAARYSPERSTIMIEGRLTKPGWVEVAVSDHGPGIPASERERVLAKYARGPLGRDAHPEGQGLGLYIARRIAEAHGGRLFISEAASGGTRVVIELELAT
jgi:signal transduction histidine kinase